jgi:SAM-dependent methyltransferase
MGEISTTGFWESANAHTHHVFCEPLGDWLVDYLKDYKDGPIYDFGCGLGSYLKKLSDNGFQNLTGFEGDPARLKQFSNIIKQDLTKPFTVPSQGNCIFLEVAEHIPAEFEEAALTNVIAACNNKLIMSWAIRGQAGFGHVNCLDNHEVIDKMTSKGFKYLEEDSMNARLINLDSAPWFKNTILIFQKV